MKINLSKTIKYWKDSSEKDYQVAKNLFSSKYYPQCLFFCHLTLEKLLKAIIIKRTKDYPPYIHDLRRLAEAGKVKLNSEQKQILDKISTFNIAGRYTNEKFEFYKEYNKKGYAEEYLKITRKLFLWLKKEFPKK